MYNLAKILLPTTLHAHTHTHTELCAHSVFSHYENATGSKNGLESPTARVLHWLPECRARTIFNVNPIADDDVPFPVTANINCIL